MRLRMLASSLLALSLGSGLVGSCGSSTVRVPIADGSDQYREVQKIDCSVYDTRRKELTVGLNFSLLFGAASAGPQVTSATETGVKWDKSVQAIVAQYKELCARFNAGAISQPSYDARLGEIDQLWSEAQGIRQSADTVIRGHSDKAFGELDKETGGGANADAQQVVASVDNLYSKVGGGR